MPMCNIHVTYCIFRHLKSCHVIITKQEFVKIPFAQCLNTLNLENSKFRLSLPFMKIIFTVKDSKFGLSYHWRKILECFGLPIMGGLVYYFVHWEVEKSLSPFDLLYLVSFLVKLDPMECQAIPQRGHQ